MYFLKENLLISTQTEGFFAQWRCVDDYITTGINSCWKCLQLKQYEGVVQQFPSRIYIITKDGKKKAINQRKELSNNTALSIFEDFEKNVWVWIMASTVSICSLPIQNNSGDLGLFYMEIYM
jgi:ABC-type Fe2+-enterobactin transport system substrate-binding protein